MSLRSYLKEEFANAKAQMSELEGYAKWQFLWDYYKLWIIGAVCLVGFLIYFPVARAMTPNDNWFYITIANTQADSGANSAIQKDFTAYSGYDPKEKNVYFNDNCYFDPADERYNAYYTSFVAYVDAGTLDLIAMERDDLELLGTRGRLLDLSRPEAAEIMEKYEDRLIYALPVDTEYSTEPVPIGIDLSDTVLVTKYHLYTDTCAVGLSANVPHMDAVLKFLAFATEDAQ